LLEVKKVSAHSTKMLLLALPENWQPQQSVIVLVFKVLVKDWPQLQGLSEGFITMLAPGLQATPD
jgi:hypothetical protein